MSGLAYLDVDVDVEWMHIGREQDLEPQEDLHASRLCAKELLS